MGPTMTSKVWKVDYHEGAEAGRTYEPKARSSRPDNETQRLMDIREGLTKTGQWRGWRNNTGQVGRIRFGLGRGGADLIGILIGSGRFCAFEIKSDTGRQEPDQKLWGDAVRAAGGFYAVVRSVREALAALKRAMNGESE